MGDAKEVFRAPMRSRDDHVVDGLAVARALREGLCGLGGRLARVPGSLEEALARAADEHDERLARRIGRFAAVDSGSLVWTREFDGAYWLGRLDGPWRYDASAEAREVDLVHVRACVWLDRPFGEPEVPASVVASFGRGGRNWQRIRAEGAGAESERVWAQER